MLVLKYLSDDKLLSVPNESSEYKAIFQLRWEILRKDWGMKPGSEQDLFESQSVHRMITAQELPPYQILACGRIQRSETEGAGQIRYMAVHRNYQKNGFGLCILQSLEEAAKEMGLQLIFLNAREPAVDFYRKAGYLITSETDSYLGIRHFRMERLL